MSPEKALQQSQQISVDGLTLFVPEMVWPPYQTGRLIASQIMPRYETIIKNGIVLDMGTGSGLIALRAGQMGARQVIATDLNAKAVSATRDNWHKNTLPEGGLSAFVSDCFEDLPAELEGQIDLVISNPPVQPMLETHGNVRERHSAYDWNEASKGGRAVLDSVLMDGLRFLADGGIIITSTSTRHGWKQTESLLNSLLDSGQISAWREIHREQYQLAAFYDKYLELWLAMEQEDGDCRVWKNGKGWCHDFIIIELTN